MCIACFCQSYRANHFRVARQNEAAGAADAAAWVMSAVLDFLLR